MKKLDYRSIHDLGKESVNIYNDLKKENPNSFEKYLPFDRSWKIIDKLSEKIIPFLDQETNPVKKRELLKITLQNYFLLGQNSTNLETHE